MCNRKLTQQQADEIRALYWGPRIRDGLDPDERPFKHEQDTIYPMQRTLAARYGVSVYAIHNVLHNKTYTGPRKWSAVRQRPPLTPEERLWAQERWRAGDTLSSMANVLNVSRTCIWKNVQGIPAPPKKWARRSVERLSDALTTATSAA